MDYITIDHCRADRDIGYIIMHDVNIEEKTKYETLVLALLLFSSLSIKIWHLWRLRIEENAGF